MLLSPFPYYVLDNYLGEWEAQTLVDSFPSVGDSRWYRYNSPLENKYALNDFTLFQQGFKDIINRFLSQDFVRWLEQLSCIENLIPDQTFYGGGLHMHGRGGKLDIHADFNRHPNTVLERRLNVIVYLNRVWELGWHGCLELWNKDMSACEVSIEPLWNRMVIMQINDTAYHGVPEPIMCPDGIYRKSIAFYYYTNGRPENEMSEPHRVDFQRRPNEEHSLDELREQRRKPL